MSHVCRVSPVVAIAVALLTACTYSASSTPLPSMSTAAAVEPTATEGPAVAPPAPTATPPAVANPPATAALENKVVIPVVAGKEPGTDVSMPDAQVCAAAACVAGTATATATEATLDNVLAGQSRALSTVAAPATKAPVPTAEAGTRVKPKATPNASGAAIRLKFDPETYQCANQPALTHTDRSWQVSAPREPMAAGKTAEIGLRNKFGEDNEAYDIAAVVIAPNGSQARASGALKGSDWANLNYPGDFAGGKAVAPGVYTVAWYVGDGFVACDGFAATK